MYAGVSEIAISFPSDISRQSSREKLLTVSFTGVKLTLCAAESMAGFVNTIQLGLFPLMKDAYSSIVKPAETVPLLIYALIISRISVLLFFAMKTLGVELNSFVSFPAVAVYVSAVKPERSL